MCFDNLNGGVIFVPDVDKCPRFRFVLAAADFVCKQEKNLKWLKRKSDNGVRMHLGWQIEIFLWNPLILVERMYTNSAIIITIVFVTAHETVVFAH